MPREKQNISLSDHLKDLFIENWSLQIDYLRYFNTCAPSLCTYSTTERTNVYYAVTFLINLFGGLVIILRLAAPFLITVFSKLKCQKQNTRFNRGTPSCSEKLELKSSLSISLLASYAVRLRKFTLTLKHINLFAKNTERSEHDVKQQKIITRVYAILLTGMIRLQCAAECFFVCLLLGSFLILVLFTSLRTQTVTIIVSQPTLLKYKELQVSRSDSLDCPCSSTSLPYTKLVLLSPVLHPICYSDFITDRWLSIVRISTNMNVFLDWRNRAVLFFQLLSNFCQLAKKTIEDAISRLHLQSFAISTVLDEIEFEAQMKAILYQFFDATAISFGLLAETVQLLTQVDQPYMGKSGYLYTGFAPNLMLNIVTNETANQDTMQVLMCSHFPDRHTGEVIC